ncbi:hypothetical protein HAX54_010562, partial [Datura stramonium]|nr:hypothetical protein [Datura stramonium]
RQSPLPVALTSLPHYGTTIRQSPLNSRQPRLLSANRPSPSAVGTPISPTPHRSAIALASKQRVVTRHSSLSLISARLLSVDSASLPTPPVLHRSTSKLHFQSSSTPPFDSNLKSST